jgi:hypothetical protein
MTAVAQVRRVAPLLVAALLLATLLGATPLLISAPAGATTAAATAGSRHATVEPLTGGRGEIALRSTTFDLASVGYEESEWLVSGVATSYTSTDRLTRTGRWSATPAKTAPFTTRFVVYRPTDPARFSGTVGVEWLNVSAGIDNTPTWTLIHTAMIQNGDVWIGASAQRAGLVGNGAPVDGLAATKAEDPARYGRLDIPSDSFSYDIYTQIGKIVRAGGGLGGLTPTTVLAIGQSQSAFRLTTYVDAIQPLTHTYDGFFVHSRGSTGAPLSQAPQAAIDAPTPTLIRDDLDVPVFVFTSESDLFGLGAISARRADDAHYREWEAGGTSHFDAYGFSIGRADSGDGAADVVLFDAMLHPTSALTGNFTSCPEPVNAGPHHYVAAAAYAALERWVVDGQAPPHAPRVRTARGRIVRDDHGNARGGIRTPEIDAPVATLSGDDPTGSCSLYGTTEAFTEAQLSAQYPTHVAFVHEWVASLDRAVAHGFVLPTDAEHLRAAAEQSNVGQP